MERLEQVSRPIGAGIARIWCQVRPRNIIGAKFLVFLNIEKQQNRESTCII
jgi:hypothetical protein